MFLRWEESTDDAYVAGNIARVVPFQAGNVKEVLADVTDEVARGQILVVLDDTDARLALERARAALADAVRTVCGQIAETARLTALVELREREMKRAQGDYDRRRKSTSPMSVSEEEMGHARDNLAIAVMALEVARHDRARSFHLVQDTPVERQPQVLARSDAVREAWLALRRCTIKSPVAGRIAKRGVQVGMHVTPGTALMAVVPLEEVWVDANFKEGQLENVKPGQKAMIEVDMYGSSKSFSGIVAGLSPGTGSAFSLLPPENATGNWIKVVQRVPVRIVLNVEELRRTPLLVGLSCIVKVDISPEAGGGPVPDLPASTTDVLVEDTAEIDAEIAAIIREHARGAAHATGS
jgi:membrane fusion protein (multidrug efflux system)